MPFRSRRRRRADTFDGLDRAFENALRIPGFRPETGRVVVMSDLHKGDGRTASDDFRGNLDVYRFALEEYWDGGYTLVLNGDAEDCWENDPADVSTSYRKTAFASERRFNEAGRYFRTAGNHDHDWLDPSLARRHLAPVLGPVSVHSALRLGERIVVLHGHQGNPHDENGTDLSRWVVRRLWVPVQRLGMTNRLRPWLRRIGLMDGSRVATNNYVRRERDRWLYEWARERRVLLIAGHTHRGMFRSYSKTDQLRAMRARLEATLASRGELRERILARTSIRVIDRVIRESREELERDKDGYRLEADPVPCYFNDGCCVFEDGITAVEIDRGRIRLVKWEVSDSVREGDASRRPEPLFATIQRKILQEDDLRRIFEEI
jgi:UDP-2,3-diacylglucosamine pyrophosphatase LpxH